MKRTFLATLLLSSMILTACSIKVTDGESDGKEITTTLEVKDFNSIDLNGSADVTADVTGSGDIEAKLVNCGHIDASTSGSGDITLKGNAKSVNANGKGVNTEELITK